MRDLDSRNVIITCAVTGAIHTPTMSPHLPITPEEIAAECIAASEAGASIVHIHTRDPETGEPVTDLNLFEQVASMVADETDVIVQPTTGGAPTMDPEERIQVVPRLEPEMCSCNLGSINFGLYQMVDAYEDWKYDWEPEYLRSTTDLIFQNTFEDLEVMLDTMGDHDTVPSLECYDVGHLYNLAHCVERELISPPYHIEFVTGIHGGIGAEPSNLLHMKQVADRLFGDEYSFSVIGAGSNQYPMGVLSTILGGHIRVGLEDNLYLERGTRAHSNAQLVNKASELAWDITGRRTASPAEVREFLGLSGTGSTAF